MSTYCIPRSETLSPSTFGGGGRLQRLLSSIRSRTERGLTPEEYDARSMLMRARPSVEQNGMRENPSMRAKYPPEIKFSHKFFMAPDGSRLAADKAHQIKQQWSHRASMYMFGCSWSLLPSHTHPKVTICRKRSIKERNKCTRTIECSPTPKQRETVLPLERFVWPGQPGRMRRDSKS